MKSYIKSFLILAFLAFASACDDIRFGDNFLGDAGESSGATTDSLFRSKREAEKILNEAYRYLPYGLPTNSNSKPDNKLGMNVLEAISDLHYSTRDNQMDGPANLYYRGGLSVNLSETNMGNEAYRFGSENDYTAIRYAWIYIENAHKIPDISETERNMRIAEAKMIIAVSYAEMLRYVGGVPILDHAVQENEVMKFPRYTFEETVNFIVTMIDQAKDYLPWKQEPVNDGRMTRAGALGLKLRVLLFAASPMFNSQELWHPAADKYTCYTNYDKARWQRAADAGKEFMDELKLKGQYQLIMPSEDTHEAQRKAYQQAYYDRGGTEILISTRKSFNVSIMDKFFAERTYSGPTLNYVNMFDWDNGTEFPEDFNWTDPSRQPFYTVLDVDGKPQLIPTRDPRLYETVAVPGSLYYNSTYAPVYTNNQFFRRGGTGFLMKKFILEMEEERKNRPVQWPYLRLSEVMLSYAEALNEVDGSPSPEAYGYVNEVRRRVGLKALDADLDQKEFREKVLKERACELGFEEVRWFDLIRWMRVDDFRKDLYGLESTSKDNPQAPTKFTFKTYKMKDRYWKESWNSKWFLAPIPYDEVNKDYGMTQNPGW